MKYRNSYINYLKRNVKNLREREKELDEEIKKFCDSKFINENLNNIINVELTKVIKKMSKHYKLNEEEALKLFLKQEPLEDEDEELVVVNDTPVYSQKSVGERKVYTKGENVYDECLNEIGTFKDGHIILYK